MLSREHEILDTYFVIYRASAPPYQETLDVMSSIKQRGGELLPVFLQLPSNPRARAAKRMKGTAV